MTNFSAAILTTVLLVFSNSPSELSDLSFYVAPTGEALQEVSVWQEFSSREGGFTILLPSQPQESLVNLKTDLGLMVLHAFTVTNGDREYRVTYTDLLHPAKNEKDTEKVLKTARQFALTGKHREMLKEQFLTLDDHPGREFRISEDSELVLIDRAYLVGKRLYQVITSFSAAKGESTETGRFLGSFRLSGAGPGLANSDKKEAGESTQKPVPVTVRVLVTVDERGNVVFAKAVDGPAQFRRRAEESARQWKFKPTLRNGVPVQVEGYLTFNFDPQ